jgi:hypothetical protein
LETLIVSAGSTVLQVPLTVRDEPLEGAGGALIAQTEHSVLGTRWVYDGLGDPRFVLMLAGVAMTGRGEALGLAQVDGRWCIAPSNIRIHGGGWTRRPVPVDGFELVADELNASVLRDDRCAFTVFRRPTGGPSPAIGLTATWEGTEGGLVLAEVRER